MFKKVDFHCQDNNSSHHTSEVTVDQLIVRRGQSFALTVELLRPYDPDTDQLRFTVETGPRASEELGTRAVFGIRGLEGFSASKAVWKAASSEHKGSQPQQGIVAVDVTPPADAPVGEYLLSVTSEQFMFAAKREVVLGKLVVLFNPWCKDDWVYLPDEAERQEYVMNEQGIIYRGTDRYITAMAWDYGQFEEDMVDICLKILDVNPKFEKDPADDCAARCNPIYVSRVVTAMINSVDDRGVLVGSWSDYFGGVSPTHWSGSVEILRKWHKFNCHAVKYGQCWVFAGVMCTVLRCLGIPCRVITNFQSAHDTDGSLTIDVLHADYGVRVRDSKDSVWNFHVWVEAWMRRPDQKEDGSYDGWQVVDPTPQERSEGVYRCGPAPVAAIRAGHTDQKYDVPFVFAEVNADCIDWLVMADGSKKNIFSDTMRIGQNVSTKSVGSNQRMDITESYKHREGTNEERRVNKHALTRDYSIEGRPRKPKEEPNETNGTNGVHTISAISMNIAEMSKPINGQDISLKLEMSSKDQAARSFHVTISTQVMRYTGVPSANVYSQQNEVTLEPGKDFWFPILVPAAAYRGHMLTSDSVKVSVMATDKERPDAIYLTEADITLENPPISITVPEQGWQGRELPVEVVFKNPLDETLRNCSLTITGSGLVRYAISARLAELGPDREVHFKLFILPYKSGVKTLLVDFDCSSFRDIKESCTVRIQPAIRLGF